MNTAGKVAGGSALVAVPATATTVAVYKDEIFGSAKEEDTYWKFFYLTFRNTTGNFSSTIKSWQDLKNECKGWTVTKSGGKTFADRASEKCAVIAAFNKSNSSLWQKYLGYFDKFKSENWGDKEIDYSSVDPTKENNYLKLWMTLIISSIDVTDESRATGNDWNPSQW